jgi:N utilization substance protein B
VTAKRAAPRSRSRQAALQVLYALDLTEATRSAAPADLDSVFEAVAENFELPEGARDFAAMLVRGIIEHRVELDALLSEHATNWRLSRMAAVDRNTLRIGAYELSHTDTPARVVLDEAIELARRFGADPSPAFVNGILDAVSCAVGRNESERAKKTPGEVAERSG